MDFSKHRDKLVVVRVTPDSNADLFQQFDISERTSVFLVTHKVNGLFTFKKFDEIYLNLDKSNPHQQSKLISESYSF